MAIWAWFRVKGAGFRIRNLGIGDWGLGCRVSGLRFGG